MPKPDLTFQALRRRAEDQLKQKNIESAALDVKLLLMAAAECDASDLIIWAANPVSEAIQSAFDQLLLRRLDLEPVAYILGHKEFWSLSFQVSPDVLIPRPETELIVEKALAYVKNINTPHLLDIGTGSGAILISLLHECKNATGVGADLSPDALAIAKANAKEIGVDMRAKFLLSNYLDDVSGTFDVIVSNPPYITANAMKSLPNNVGQFEPHLALSGGEDGLVAYRAIIEKASAFLKPKGQIIFEIGYDQGADVSACLATNGFENICVEKDLAGHDRIVCGNLST